MVVNVVKTLYPAQDYTWLVEEVKVNLPRELDFLNEAANAERCRSNFASARCVIHGPMQHSWLNWSHAAAMDQSNWLHAASVAGQDASVSAQDALAECPWCLQ
jgi:hypothetical protein